LINLLIVHNTNNTNTFFEEKVHKKYSFLSESGMYKIKCISFDKKIPQRKFDLIYFDSNSIEKMDSKVLNIINHNNSATIIWIDLNSKQKAKLHTFIKSPITHLTKRKKN